jgi:hypothetical protein
MQSAARARPFGLSGHATVMYYPKWYTNVCCVVCVQGTFLPPVCGRVDMGQIPSVCLSTLQQGAPHNAELLACGPLRLPSPPTPTSLTVQFSYLMWSPDKRYATLLPSSVLPMMPGRPASGGICLLIKSVQQTRHQFLLRRVLSTPLKLGLHPNSIPHGCVDDCG